MKTIKYIDLAIQTLLILVGGAWVFSRLWQSKSDWLEALLYVQLLTGIWQYLSSITSVLYSVVAGTGVKPVQKEKHLAFSTLYLLILWGCMLFVFSTIPQPVVEYVYLIFLIIPPWTLAFYYYSLCWRSVLQRHKRQSKFLPHTSF